MQETIVKKRTETVCSTFKSTWQIISRMYNAEATKYGGSISTAYFLLNIDSNNGSYLSDISNSLNMEITSLSRMVKSLEEDKVILRKNDKDDKRKTKILLTSKGKKHKELAKNVVRDFNKNLEEKLGHEKIATFFSLTSEIKNITEDYTKKINLNKI